MLEWSSSSAATTWLSRGGSGVPMKRQIDVSKLRKELAKAVEAEDYERAAKLRDQIKTAEGYA